MFACLDVDYRADHAVASCVVFNDWKDAAAVEEHVARIMQVEPYVAGQFYRRELPCLLAVLQKVTVPLDAVVIDGYVCMDDKSAPGLGMHLFEALHREVPVIGVAKTRFATAVAEEVFRPGSARPLLVTAVGVDAVLAATPIRSMHGAHRIPTLLKRADTLCRQSG